MTDQGNRLITVFGGSGFVGRHTVRALAADGWRIRVACRRPDLAFHLQPLGRVGQIHAVQANVRYPASVQAALNGAQAAINLTGILAPSGRQGFEAVHGFGARQIARAAGAAGVGTLVHMSAIGADSNSASEYARSKAHGEAAVLEHFPAARIVRPSIVFGPEDDFFNRFAAIARMAPVMPLIGGGQTKFQPVYVGDVAGAIARLAAGAGQPGAVYELGGPEVKTFEELLRFICEETGRKRAFVPVPWALASFKAFGLEMTRKLSLGLWPEWLTVTRDQIRLLQNDNVVSPQAKAEGRTLEGLGVTPSAMAAIVPSYLYRFRKAGQFSGPKAA
ncbi:MAG: complex I NDUFA9 subunit family protein [Alphaproteobacteria bacterium]|nr:complex I NDUFA9 subunit family protein [Alphaproteobacteria bacterium]